MLQDVCIYDSVHFRFRFYFPMCICDGRVGGWGLQSCCDPTSLHKLYFDSEHKFCKDKKTRNEMFRNVREQSIAKPRTADSAKRYQVGEFWE